MEAEKCLTQSERFNQEKVEFESAIYTKVNGLTFPTCFFAVIKLLLLISFWWSETEKQSFFMFDHKEIVL